MTLNLRAKILLSVIAMILVVVLAALALINHLVRRQVFASVSSDLVRAREIADELQKRELELLLERSLVVAEAPYLKAAVETGDAATVQQVAEQVYQAMHSDLLLITAAEGRVLAQVGAPQNWGKNFSAQQLVQREILADTEVGLLARDSALYRIVLAPIVSRDQFGRGDLLGAAVFGNRIDLAELEHYRDLTNSEVAFLLYDKIAASTLNALPAFTPWQWGYADSLGLGITTVHLQDGDYFAALPRVHKRSTSDYALLRAERETLDPLLRPIQLAILSGLVVLAVGATLGVSYVMGRSVVNPVRKLVFATDAVSGGDYDHPIAVSTRDEIGYLARKFDEMRHSLKRQMAQLAQRNFELENALRQLERTQAELVQTEKLAATGKITAQLSHELNNPIHNIRSCLEAARKKLDETHGARNFLDLAHEEVLRLARLAQQMLDFHRPQPLERELVRVDQLVRELVKSSEELLRRQRVACEVKLPAELPPLRASRDQLKQVLLNLLLNAVDAMPNGGALRISANLDNGWMNVSLADSGIGIPKQNLERIFDAFFTTKSKASGVGLGLSVSYGIVRSHGGRIHVESEAGKGSTFTVKLPVAT